MGSNYQCVASLAKEIRHVESGSTPMFFGVGLSGFGSGRPACRRNTSGKWDWVAIRVIEQSSLLGHHLEEAAWRVRSADMAKKRAGLLQTDSIASQRRMASSRSALHASPRS